MAYRLPLERPLGRGAYSFCNGPNTSGTPQSAQYTQRWAAWVSAAGIRIAEYAAGDVLYDGYGSLQTLFTSGETPSKVSLCFDETALPCIAIQHNATTIRLRKTVSAAPFSVDFAGLSPAVFWNGEVEPNESDADVICYYIKTSGTSIFARIQRESFATEHTIHSTLATPLDKLLSVDRFTNEALENFVILYALAKDGRQVHYVTDAQGVFELQPPAIPNRILWFRADYGATIGGLPPASGGAIDEWEEKDLGVSNAAQGTSAWRPTWVDLVVGNRPVIRFNPASISANFAQHLRIPNADCPAAFAGIGTGEYSIFCVYRPVNFTNRHLLLSKNILNNNSQIPVLGIEPSGQLGIATGSGGVAASSSLCTAGAWNRIGIGRSESDATMRFFLNGATEQVVLFSGAGDNSNPCFMGARHDGDSLGETGAAGMNGDLAEMLVYNHYATAAQALAMDAYFVSRYAF